MNFTTGQNVKIVSGKHAGKIAFFTSYSRREGKCFVDFKTFNRSGAQVSLSSIEAA